jgi:hypothetical protein
MKKNPRNRGSSARWGSRSQRGKVPYDAEYSTCPSLLA